MRARFVPVAALVLVAVSFAWPAAVAADAPTASDDAFVVLEATNFNNLRVLDNDTFIGSAAITDITDPAHGVAQPVAQLTRIAYSPDDGFVGTDTFDYTVTTADGSDTATVTITVNAPPVAVDDPAVPQCNALAGMFGDSFPIPEDWGELVLTGSCSPTINDSDADGSIASWQIDTAPAHGTIDWLPSVPGVIGYTPDADFSTASGDWPSDAFTYHVVDDLGASSNSAIYRLWIAPVNDAPSFTAGAGLVNAATNVAYDAAWATNISAGPPNESDQTVHFEITDVDEHGLAGLFAVAPSIAANGHLTFTGAERGLATVTVVAKDDGGLEDYNLPALSPADTSAPVSFDIAIGNAGPIAADDELTVLEDASLTPVDVLANDTDADDDPLTVTGKTNGAKGSVTIALDGSSVSYKPNANAFGSDSFTYTASDGQGGTDTATVDVTITPVNDVPNAVNDPGPFAIYLRALPRSIPVLLNDTSSPDGPETLTIIAVTQGGHGKVAITGGGTGLTYASTGSTLGYDQFTYTISDGNGGTDTASVQVRVIADATKPKAVITSLTKASIVGKPKAIRISLKWTLTDTGSGLKSQLLQRRTDAGSWVTVTLPSLTTRTASFALPKGHTYTFRVRGTDRYGNVGAFATRSIAT